MHYSKTINGLSYVLKNGDNRALIEKIGAPDLYFFSPPYNIGSKCEQKITNRKNGGYDAKSYRSITDYPDNLPEDEYQRQQIEILNLCGQNLAKDGCIVYNHKNRYKNGRMISPHVWIDKTNLELVTEVTWNRRSTHENGRTHPRPIEEKLYILTMRGFKPYYGPRFDKTMKNITTILEINKQTDNIHNAAFPIELASVVIEYFCKPRGTVCDIYSGSGTTMCAAYMRKRNFIGSELLSDYFNLSVERFRKIIQGEFLCQIPS